MVHFHDVAKIFLITKKTLPYKNWSRTELPGSNLSRFFFRIAWEWVKTINLRRCMKLQIKAFRLRLMIPLKMCETHVPSDSLNSNLTFSVKRRDKYMQKILLHIQNKSGYVYLWWKEKGAAYLYRIFGKNLPLQVNVRPPY